MIPNEPVTRLPLPGGPTAAGRVCTLSWPIARAGFGRWMVESPVGRDCRILWPGPNMVFIPRAQRPPDGRCSVVKAKFAMM